MNQREEQILRDTLILLKTHLNPFKIILFGSRAKGESVLSSDFDLAVDCERIDSGLKIKIKEEIETICGLYNVDVVYLNEIEEEFKNIILKTGKVIYARGT